MQGSDFQSESKRSGDEFEEIVLADITNRGFTSIWKNVHVESTGCEVDFLAIGENLVTEYVESKGGRLGEKKRPGAQRTDNVKKAIANAALIKTKYPDIKYVIYFSAKPNAKSYSEEMINTATAAGIVDEIRYLDYNNRMV